MKIFTFGTLVALLTFSACGEQLVEFPRGNGGDDDGNPDNPDGNTGTLPTVISTTPLDVETDVSITHRVTATFSRPMDGTTLGNSSFIVKQGATTLAGTVSYEGTTATFLPAAPLSLSLQYTATITTDAADPLGARLATDHVWTFTTGACSLERVALLSAGAFALLAGSTVTNTGPSDVIGDLGVSPGTAVVGYPPGNLDGDQHAGNQTAALAVADLTTAYNDAAGRTLCAVTVAGNLGGMTLAPGLYKSTSSLEVSSGDLTLDAQGDPDAVFIFQTASTLTTTAKRHVTLAGGALAANVFWQVGSSATFGTNSTFQGTVMADQAITLETGASLNGRALARIAAVSMDNNMVLRP
jgi:hypothetical protein